jgi:hypothetical protein
MVDELKTCQTQIAAGDYAAGQQRLVVVCQRDNASSECNKGSHNSDESADRKGPGPAGFLVPSCIQEQGAGQGDQCSNFLAYEGGILDFKSQEKPNRFRYPARMHRVGTASDQTTREDPIASELEFLTSAAVIWIALASKIATRKRRSRANQARYGQRQAFQSSVAQKWNARAEKDPLNADRRCFCWKRPAVGSLTRVAPLGTVAESRNSSTRRAETYTKKISK